MAIPALNEHGLLPDGIHDCTLQEAEARFARFQESDRRPRLWTRFKEFVHELELTGLRIVILVDGSFVTAKANPNDIDVILALPSTHDLGRDLSVAEYNVLSAPKVKQRYGMDLLVARAGSDQYDRYVRFFQQVRFEPERNKGILRVEL
ncbi:MAG TPA: hypothetical protein VK615_06100 [Candidatus Binatia bacterium]|nr:hypothetical protein [Candidatus Binatia bacterium]